MTTFLGAIRYPHYCGHTYCHCGYDCYCQPVVVVHTYVSNSTNPIRTKPRKTRRDYQAEERERNRRFIERHYS